MKNQGRTGTNAEVAIRRELHRRGLRYRVDFAPLESNRRRRADIVFTRAKLAVFVDGCFWHGCPEHGTSPKNNARWWQGKLDANRRRDADTNQALRDCGWIVLRFWEHDDPILAAETIAATLREIAVDES